MQHFCIRVYTALLADLARTNVKSALDRDKLTWYSCTVQLSDHRWRFQLVSLHIEVLLVWSNNRILNHAHHINRARAWCRDYSRAGFISFNPSQITGAGTIQGWEEIKEIRHVVLIVQGACLKLATSMCLYNLHSPLDKHSTRSYRVRLIILVTGRGACFARPLLYPFCVFHHVATPTACSIM